MLYKYNDMDSMCYVLYAITQALSLAALRSAMVIGVIGFLKGRILGPLCIRSRFSFCPLGIWGISTCTNLWGIGALLALSGSVSLRLSLELLSAVCVRAPGSFSSMCRPVSLVEAVPLAVGAVGVAVVGAAAVGALMLRPRLPPTMELLEAVGAVGADGVCIEREGAERAVA
jgi:hypothetical protein